MDIAADVLDVLAHGKLALEGRIVDASNATLFAHVSLDGVTLDCVYKPRSGERPLWDFPEGTLSLREVAAYEVSAAAGWHLVPETVWREDGPLGAGMCQRWVEIDRTATLVDVVERGQVPPGWVDVVDAQGAGGRPVSLVHADTAALRRLVLLDAVINNADRKGGHVLLGDDGWTYGIDHGVAFHEDDKLRTVLWGWAGDQIDLTLRAEAELLQDALAGAAGTRLSELLTRRELRRTSDRLHRLLGRGVYPYPGEGWPSLPWPPF